MGGTQELRVLESMEHVVHHGGPELPDVGFMQAVVPIGCGRDIIPLGPAEPSYAWDLSMHTWYELLAVEVNWRSIPQRHVCSCP